MSYILSLAAVSLKYVIHIQHEKKFNNIENTYTEIWLKSGSSVTEICHTHSALEEVQQYRKHLHRNMGGMELEDFSQCATIIIY